MTGPDQNTVSHTNKQACRRTCMSISSHSCLSLAHTSTHKRTHTHDTLSSQPVIGWAAWYVRLRSAGWERMWRGGNSCKWCSSHWSMPPNSPLLTSGWPLSPRPLRHPPLRPSDLSPPSTHRSPCQPPISEDEKPTTKAVDINDRLTRSCSKTNYLFCIHCIK